MIRFLFYLLAGMLVCLAAVGSESVGTELAENAESKPIDQRIEDMRAEQRQLRNELASEIDIASKKCGLSAREKSRLAKMRALLTEIDARIEAENNRPKTKFITSTTQEEPYKAYYLDFASRVLEAGSKSFPMRNGKKVYGKAGLQVEIAQDGALKKVEALDSTDRAISVAAIALVRRLSPFSPIPSDVTEKVFTILVKFNYTHSEGDP